jgi:hypothetical protein
MRLGVSSPGSYDIGDEKFVWEDSSLFESSTPGKEISLDELMTRWHVHKDNYAFKFNIEPNEPVWDEKADIRLSVFDISSKKHIPVNVKDINCSAVMPNDQPNMQGILHTYKTHKCYLNPSTGVYGMPIVFGMGGNWVFRYIITMDNGKEYMISFPVKVRRPDDPLEESEQLQK